MARRRLLRVEGGFASGAGMVADAPWLFGLLSPVPVRMMAARRRPSSDVSKTLDTVSGSTGRAVKKKKWRMTISDGDT